ncbi:aminotransferase-like domain-containing protein [Noviherbaspirillum galbum]|uniref:PLP-dependent aminotransferase family protein n=1 Tax=Noviherbaspirillum galbum TaxID=2709383 RepID=A0A6B3SUD2_9BURK|nr:PLP-dependent aminotransferase family protein [Noviherbaspirillum galbum]NEX64620.1 PLP-dependent aminotransferase family protein [Noviherbaspirillum galbum]
MDNPPLYRQLADHYRAAITAGTIAQGQRVPSVRAIMRQHGVSLSTALQACRQLEQEGWLEARPRSGYFASSPRRSTVLRLPEPDTGSTPDPAQYVGIHARVSDYIARGRAYPIKTNFSGARAAPSLYPAEELRKAGVRALRRDAHVLVRAAPAGGNRHFRAVLAKRALENGLVISPEEITVTHGCIEALNLALRAVTQPGDTVAVESPTFYGLLQILESLGLRALEIPTSATTGLSIEALELAVRAYGNIKAVVVVPHLQNPTGSIMPDAHKQRLVRLCEQQAIPLIEDDTYSALADGENPSTSLKAWDRSGNVIHCASLHKTLAPGMRMGWMVAGRWQARVAMLKYAQTRDNPDWPQATLAEFLESSAYDRHLRRLRVALRRQRERMAEAIATHFPLGTRMSIPDSGVTLWVALPEQASSSEVFDAALLRGILFAPGSVFSNSDRFEHCMRINCGEPWSEQLDDAVRTLGELVRDAGNAGRRKPGALRPALMPAPVPAPATLGATATWFDAIGDDC